MIRFRSSKQIFLRCKRRISAVLYRFKMQLFSSLLSFSMAALLLHENMRQAIDSFITNTSFGPLFLEIPHRKNMISSIVFVLASVSLYKPMKVFLSMKPIIRKIDKYLPSEPDFINSVLETKSSNTSSPRAAGRPFVGRKAEMTLLRNFADDDRLCTGGIILGPSGIGKTRLAVEWLRTLEQENWDVGFAQNIPVFQETSVWSPRKKTAFVISKEYFSEEFLSDLLSYLDRNVVHKHKIRILCIAKGAYFSTNTRSQASCGKIYKFSDDTCLILQPLNSRADIMRFSRSLGNEVFSTTAFEELGSTTGFLPAYLIPLIEFNLSPWSFAEKEVRRIMTEVVSHCNTNESYWQIVAISCLFAPLSHVDRQRVLKQSFNLKGLHRILPFASLQQLDKEIPVFEPSFLRGRLGLEALCAAPKADVENFIRSISVINPVLSLYGISLLLSPNIYCNSSPKSNKHSIKNHSHKVAQDNESDIRSSRIELIREIRKDIFADLALSELRSLRAKQHEAGLNLSKSIFYSALDQISSICFGWESMKMINDEVIRSFKCASSHVSMSTLSAVERKNIAHKLFRSIKSFISDPSLDENTILAALGIIVLESEDSRGLLRAGNGDQFVSEVKLNPITSQIVQEAIGVVYSNHDHANCLITRSLISGSFIYFSLKRDERKRISDELTAFVKECANIWNTYNEAPFVKTHILDFLHCAILSSWPDHDGSAYLKAMDAAATFLNKTVQDRHSNVGQALVISRDILYKSFHLARERSCNQIDIDHLVEKTVSWLPQNSHLDDTYLEEFYLYLSKMYLRNKAEYDMPIDKNGSLFLLLKRDAVNRMNSGRIYTEKLFEYIFIMIQIAAFQGDRSLQKVLGIYIVRLQKTIPYSPKIFQAIQELKQKRLLSVV